MKEDDEPRILTGYGVFLWNRTKKEAAVYRYVKRRWIWLVIPVFVTCGVIQTTFAWDMIPPTEPVRNITKEFDQAWRLEAERKFSQPRLIGANHVASAFMLFILITLLVWLFHRMVRSNHMERSAKKVRSDMLSFYTRMWLISRWGFRY